MRVPVHARALGQGRRQPLAGNAPALLLGHRGGRRPEYRVRVLPRSPTRLRGGSLTRYPGIWLVFFVASFRKIWANEDFENGATMKKAK